MLFHCFINYIEVISEARILIIGQHEFRKIQISRFVISGVLIKTREIRRRCYRPHRLLGLLIIIVMYLHITLTELGRVKNVHEVVWRSGRHLLRLGTVSFIFLVIPLLLYGGTLI